MALSMGENQFGVKSMTKTNRHPSSQGTLRKKPGVMKGSSTLWMYTARAANSRMETISIHHALNEKKSVRNAAPPPKSMKPGTSIFFPLPLSLGRLCIRIGIKKMVTTGMRKRNCQCKVASHPPARIPMTLESWKAAVKTPKNMTFNEGFRYFVATTR